MAEDERGEHLNERIFSEEQRLSTCRAEIANLLKRTQQQASTKRYLTLSYVAQDDINDR